MTDNSTSLSRPSSIRRIRKNNGKEPTISLPNSRPSSRPSSRPTSRPVSPTGNLNEDNDQIIPTAIVIKNIPFSVKKDALLSKLASMDVPAAYAFNYHFDNGVFRGLAFANYKTPEETEIVVNTINGLEIGGRKLRVEYKKMLPNMMDNDSRKKEREMSNSSSSQPGSPMLTERRLPTSSSSSSLILNNSNSNNNNNNSSSNYNTTNNSDDDTLDLNNPNVLELYSFLLLFRGDPNSTEIALPKTLSAKERRDAHLIADRLGLAHYSEGFGADRQVVIEKRGSVPAPIVRLQHKNSRSSLKSSPSRERLNNSGSNTENKRDSYRKSMMSTSTTAEVLSSVNTTTTTTANSGIIHPIRQPRGPEPGKNFASRMNTTTASSAADGNSTTSSDQLSDNFSRQLHVGA